jgi:hypothetical protein
MLKINNRASSSVVLCVTSLLIGCAQHRGPHSAYQTFYQNRLVGITVPSFAEIASLKDEALILEQPAQSVWDICIELATQSKGILGVADDAGGGHRLLIISGETLNHKSGRPVFVDRWLAISVRPTAEKTTEVRIVFVSPTTARVTPFNKDSVPEGFKGDPQRFISLSTIEDFSLALKKTLEEDGYLRRLKAPSQPTPRGVLPAVDVKSMGKGEAVAQQWDNFQSATLRRQKFVLNVPRLEERIAGVIHNLATTAHQVDKETKVFVIADVARDIHIKYNGDLFITTRALDEIEDLDELAGILAHELSHIYLHHGPIRGLGYKRAGLSSHTMIALGTLGGALIGGVIPTSTPHSGAPKDSLLSTQDVLIGGGVGAGAMLLAGQVGTTIGNDLGNFTIYRFTRTEELAADDYGAELLWASGYNYRGLLKYLQRVGDDKLIEKKAGRAH